MNDLPEGWKRIRLDSIAEVRLGRQRSPKRATGPNMRPYMRAANVTWQGLDTSDVKEMDFTDKEMATYRLEEGDLLLGEASGSMYEVGKSAVWRGEIPNCCFQNTLIRVRAPKELVPFLHERFKADARLGNFARASRGVGIFHLSKGTLAAWEIELPPLDQQRRIVEKIETLNEHSRAAREALEQIPPLLERYRQSVLAAAFRGDLTAEWRAQNPDVEPASVLLERIRTERRRRWEEDYLAKQRAKGKEPKNDKWKAKYKEALTLEQTNRSPLPRGWVWARLSDLRALEPYSFVDGPFGSKLKTADYVDSGVRVIRLGNLGVGEFKDKDRSFVSREKFETLQKHEAKAGDLLIAALAEPVGRCCRVPPNLGIALVKADCVRLKVHPEVSPTVVMHWLNSHPGRLIAESLSHGVGRLRINMGNMRELPIPVPPVGEQLALVEAVDEALGAIAGLSQTTADSTKSVDLLSQSILGKAFRGELLSQPTSDDERGTHAAC